jgi:Flp pilus assembly protein CpaB
MVSLLYQLMWEIGAFPEVSAMASTALLSPTRALRQPRRLDLRAAFAVFLLLLATGGSIAAWSAMSDTQAVLVATRDLPAGATIGPTDLTVARVRLDDALYQAAVPANELSQLVGRPLAEPVHARQLLVRAQLSSRPPLGPNQLALAIPVNAHTAVGGRLRPGDRVQVLVTVDKGKPEARTTVVLPRVIVFDVGYDERAAVVHTAGSDASGRAAQGPIAWVTLILSPEQAVQLAQAKWAGELDLALLPPQ